MAEPRSATPDAPFEGGGPQPKAYTIPAGLPEVRFNGDCFAAIAGRVPVSAVRRVRPWLAASLVPLASRQRASLGRGFLQFGHRSSQSLHRLKHWDWG